MTDNNQDIDIFFREMEQVSEPDMQHYQAHWNAMQDMMAGKTILPRNHRWNPGMLNSLLSMMIGGCLVAGLISVFSKKQRPQTTDPVNPPAAQIKLVLTQDSVGDTLQNNSTFYKQNTADSVRTANTQTKITNSQTKIEDTQTKIAEKQMKTTDTQLKTIDMQLKTANTLMKAKMELIDKSIQTYQSDTLIGDRREAAQSLKPQTAIKVHYQKPYLESVSAIDSSFEISQKLSLSTRIDSITFGSQGKISTAEVDLEIAEQKLSFKKPVSFSFDTVLIPFKNTSLKPIKKSRMATRADTTTRKQKHLPDKTIHH